MKLTICFYEFPKAITEINNWEKSFANNIIYSNTNEKIKRFYLKYDNEKYEYLICIPINYILYNDLSSIKNIISNSYFEDLKYSNIKKFDNNIKFNKLLIFGKIELNEIEYIYKFFKLISSDK